jgi:DNA repair protein RAD50
LRKERTAELKVDRERLNFMKADKDKAERVCRPLDHVVKANLRQMRKELSTQIETENSKQTLVENMREEVEHLKEINVQLYAEATGFQSIFERHEGLKSKKAMLEGNRKHILDGMTPMNGKLSDACCWNVIAYSE